MGGLCGGGGGTQYVPQYTPVYQTTTPQDTTKQAESAAQSEKKRLAALQDEYGANGVLNDAGGLGQDQYKNAKINRDNFLSQKG